MVRRYVFDPAANAVVEIGTFRNARDARTRYVDAKGEYRDAANHDPSDEAGARFRAATLERADRREYAFRRFGDERRWSE
jgi:hypothetical protein